MTTHTTRCTDCRRQCPSDALDHGLCQECLTRRHSFGTTRTADILDHPPQPGMIPANVYLWDATEADFTDAVLEGLYECTFDEYRRRLADATAEIQRRGIPVTLVTARLCDLIATIHGERLPVNNASMAAAIALTAQKGP